MTVVMQVSWGGGRMILALFLVTEEISTLEIISKTNTEISQRYLRKSASSI